MAQYIDKAVLVAEIEKRLDELWDLLPNASDVVKDNYTKEEANIIGKYTTLESFSKFLDTLEIKEVDLEKHIKEDIEDIFFDLDGVAVKGTTHYLTVEDVKDIAKHFFELGIKAQKGE